MALLFLPVLAFIACAHAQVFKLGACPDLPVKQNFNASMYTGIWYEYERYFAVFELFGTCTYANYALREDGKIDVLNTGVNRFTGNPTSAHGEAYAPDPKVPAKLLVKFDQSPASAGPYWVLETDYDNYSIVYSCTDVTSRLVNTRAEIVWILSRRREGPGTSNVQKAEGILKKLGVSTYWFMKTKQDNCSN